MADKFGFMWDMFALVDSYVPSSEVDAFFKSLLLSVILVLTADKFRCLFR